MMTSEQAKAKIQVIEQLVAELIAEFSCGDEECSTCKIGVALGTDAELAYGTDGEWGIPCLNKAFSAGYKAHSDESDASIGEL